jgi:hypothetical protein
MSDLVLLRNIVSHLTVGPHVQMNDHESYMSRGFSPLTNVAYGLARAAWSDLHKLTKSFFTIIPGVKRKISYDELALFLSSHITSTYYIKKDVILQAEDIANVEQAIISWLEQTCSARQVYVPCLINTSPARSFAIGPVIFDHLDNFTKPAAATPEFDPFPEIYNRMRDEDCLWMATISLPPCSDAYGYKLADLCVDIALTGFQLVIPLHYSKSVCRMHSKRMSNATIHTTVANGALGQNHSTAHAGFWLGSGSIEEFITHNPKLLGSVGERLEVYTTNATAVPELEMAWCDAAYWFHEGVAEPVDSIATCKLETALEVLLRGTNGSNAREVFKLATRFAFEIDDDEEIFKSPAVIAKDFIDQIWNVRSRILHGTLSTLDTEAAGIRAQLEKFVGIMLQVYTLELSNYIRQPKRHDDIKSFFAWSEVHRTSNPSSRFATDS